MQNFLDQPPSSVYEAIMHEVDKWLQRNEKSRQWLAGRLGISEASLSRAIAQKQWPKPTFFVEIARLTHGEITVHNFLKNGGTS